MKKILVLLFLANSFLFAQISTDSKVTAVTVYKNNAEVVSEANASLPAGTSEILIRNVSTQINPASLQVGIKSNGKVSLLSASFRNDFINSNELSDEQQEWRDKLDKLEVDLRWAKEQKQIYYDLEVVLNENRKLGGANVGLSPSDLSQLLEIYKTKQYDYNQAFLKYEKQEKDLNIEVNKVRNQLNQVNAKANKPSGTIVLKVSAVAPSSTDFRCSYIVNNAGWTPIYDLRSEGTDKPVDLIYKANIYQNSGYDWSRVDLTVSTGNPVQNNNRPILNPLYVNYYQPYASDTYGGKAYKEAPAANMAYAEVELDMKRTSSDDFEEGFAFTNTEVNSQFSTQYEVSLPQSIPSDGQYHLVGLESYELKSEYAYHTVPKLDKGAFLLAKVSDWGKYNLLPGTTNIFFEGAYVGQSDINPNVSSDTLLISLGRDEGIKVTRIKLQEFCSTKLIGSNKTETYAYEIEIRNNKNYAIDIEVLDQIPISKQKDIQVELEEDGAAKYLADFGKLEWNITLGANQSKKLKFVYTVKYPKDKSITGQK